MNNAWLDILSFTLFTGFAWFVLSRKKKVSTNPEEKLQIELFPTSEVPQEMKYGSFELWFRRQIEMARLPVPSSVVPLMMVAIAMILLVLVFVLTEDVVAAVIVGVGTMLACFVALIGIAAWRVRKFRQQLPMALDIMVGAVKSGDSLAQSFRLLSTTMQEPAKTEFTRCRNQLDMGLSLRETTQSLASRIGTVDAKMFAKMLSVHRDTGGHLTTTLQRLARVIRSRFEYERHLQSTTGMGRMSVIVVVSLAWIIFGYVAVMKPDYGRVLWEDPTGHKMLLTAFVLEVIGVVWAMSLMRSKY